MQLKKIHGVIQKRSIFTAIVGRFDNVIQAVQSKSVSFHLLYRHCVAMGLGRWQKCAVFIPPKG